jgi:hypothetical protein
MASIQSKKGKNGKKTYYVVIRLKGRHKWIRAGTTRDAKILKREIESLGESKKVEKLGFAQRDRRIDSSFQEYMEYMKPRAAINPSSTILAFVFASQFRRFMTELLACESSHKILS